ncbi:hypothetical protein AZE42_11978 [Rhizopogon vesiculosus]|uniref:Uncharacterized protein n=1 Tax=Rhizopogon vesiculosus TaxID=180088 RepID=A0A1J8QFG0_9AGAM|nr:hypothetical protein AZE42_11978 [Rhizopogon vesiculosus]
MIPLSLVAIVLLPFTLAAPQLDAGVIHVPIHCGINMVITQL